MTTEQWLWPELQTDGQQRRVKVGGEKTGRPKPAPATDANAAGTAPPGELLAADRRTLELIHGA